MNWRILLLLIIYCAMIRTEKPIKPLNKNKCAFFTSLLIVLIFLSNRSDRALYIHRNTLYVLVNPQLEYYTMSLSILYCKIRIHFHRSIGSRIFMQDYHNQSCLERMKILGRRDNPTIT